MSPAWVPAVDAFYGGLEAALIGGAPFLALLVVVTIVRRLLQAGD